MISGKTVLAIIPAREGSKRVPMKNLTLFRGKPLIQWAIEHGSKYVDRTVVVSDSGAILLHAVFPVARLSEPEFLATDSATSEAVIAYCLYQQKELPDYFVLLQPTSPLRTAEDIDTCIERAVKHTGRSEER